MKKNKQKHFAVSRWRTDSATAVIAVVKTRRRHAVVYIELNVGKDTQGKHFFKSNANSEPAIEANVFVLATQCTTGGKN